MKRLYSACLIIVIMLLLVSCTASFNGEEDINNKKSNIAKVNSPFVVETGQRVPYSLDVGASWQSANNFLAEFDIWDTKYNEEVLGMVFFYATSYNELLEKVEDNKTTKFYSYNYLDDSSWDEVLNTYNEEYFDNNILLFYYKYEPNISKNYVYSVTVDDNSLFLNINRFEGMSTALSAWVDFVTIKKENVENVTEFNVVVRTISQLQASVSVSPTKAYMRHVYVNGLSKADFLGLDNLKSVKVWTYSIMIDIKFNQTLANKTLDNIVDILKSSENIRSVGYTSNTWVRVQIDNKFYDKYMSNTLKLNDVLDNKIKNSDYFTMDVLSFNPIAIITLEMEQPGRENAEAMTLQLKELNLEFIDYKSFN